MKFGSANDCGEAFSKKLKWCLRSDYILAVTEDKALNSQIELMGCQCEWFHMKTVIVSVCMTSHKD